MTINCQGELLNLTTPKIMGIINLTPDSFYDGGRLKSNLDILQRAEQMVAEGVDVLDVGAQSTRPNAQLISANQELQRVLPVVHQLAKEFSNLRISIDTFWAKVAKEAVESGACMVNDVSAGSIDKQMFATVAKLQVPYVLMHMKGNPNNMQIKPEYKDVVLEVNQFFSKHLQQLREWQIKDVILDPGFGFGKTIVHNYTLLNNLDLIGFKQNPILVGISRKSMIYKVLESNPEEALHGTSMLNTIALLKGAKILRVHDVKPAKDLVKLLPYLRQNNYEQ